MTIEASYVVEINWDAFNITPFSGEFDNISNRLVDMTWRIGRDVPNAVVGRSVPGTFTGTFRNNDGFFSRYNELSPIQSYFSQNAQPKEINIRTLWPVALNQFNGYIEDIRVGSTIGQDKVAIITATGILTAMARMDANTTSVFLNSTADEVMDPLSSYPVYGLLKTFDANYFDKIETIQPCNTVMTRWYASDVNLLDAVKELEATEAGFVREGKNGKFIFRDRYHRFNATRSNTSQATWSDHEFMPISFVAINPGNPTRNIYTKATATVQYWTVQPTAVVYTLPYVPSLSLSPLWADETDLLYLLTPITDAGIDHINDWGIITGIFQPNANLVANSEADGSGADLSSLIGTLGPTSEYARYTDYVLKQLVDQTGTIYPTAYITSLEISADPVIKGGIVRVESGSNYLGTYNIPTMWLPSPEFALDYCNYILAEYGVPRITLQVAMKGNRTEQELIEVLTRDLEDRVTIQADNMGGIGSKIGINGDFFIESMVHKVNADRTHDVVYELSEVTTDTYWQLGVSNLGVETRLML